MKRYSVYDHEELLNTLSNLIREYSDAYFEGANLNSIAKLKVKIKKLNAEVNRRIQKKRLQELKDNASKVTK